MADWNLQPTSYENFTLNIGEAFALLIDSTNALLIEANASSSTEWTLQVKN